MKMSEKGEKKVTQGRAYMFCLGTGGSSGLDSQSTKRHEYKNRLSPLTSGNCPLVFFFRSLYSTFITPWADSSAAHTVEPDFHLPACYNVAPPPPGPNKAAAFSDETLFFMFYSSPRDALQEVAAQELYVATFTPDDAC